MKKKTTFAAVLVTVAAMLLGGCAVRSESDVTITPAGTVNYTATAGVDEDLMNQYAAFSTSLGEPLTAADLKAQFKQQAAAQGATTKEEQIGGVNYLLATQTKQNLTTAEAESSLSNDVGLENVCMTPEYFYAVYPGSQMTEDEDGAQVAAMLSQMTVYMRLSMVFPAPVTSTNGTVDPANACRVTWEVTNATQDVTVYATTKAATAAASTSSVKNNKAYKTNKKIDVTGSEGLIKMTIAPDNGMHAGTAIPSGYTVKKNGNYVVKLWSANGQCQVVRFSIDKKKPKVAGAKNGKTYKKNVKLVITDDVSGIKSATINGKKIATKKLKGYTVKKNGKYKVVVKDKAGNKTVVTFKIKK